MSQNIDISSKDSSSKNNLIELFKIYLELLTDYFYNPFCYKILSLSIDDLYNFFINSQNTSTNTKNIYFQFPNNMTIEQSAELVINFLFINITPLYNFLTDVNYKNKSNLINNELDTKIYNNYKNIIIENDTEKVNNIYEKLKNDNTYTNLKFKTLNKFISVKNFIDLLSFILNDDNKYLLSNDDNILSNVIFNVMFKNIENFVSYCISINDLFSESKQSLKNNYINTLDYYIDKQSSDTVLTFLKIRCDEFYNGTPIYNSRFKYKLYKNKIMKLHYNDDDENYYKYENENEPILNVENINCAYKQAYISSNDKRITISNNYNIPDEYYKQVYIFGQFSNIFEPNDDNNTIANKMKIVIESLINKKPVFIIGYGASGAGKTSSLIYFNKKNEDGILVNLCNIMAQKYKYNKIEMKCREFYVNYFNEQDMEFNKNEREKTRIRYIPENKNNCFNFKYDNNKFKLVLDNNEINYIHTNKYTDKTYPDETTTFDSNTSLGEMVIHLIDNDRFVSATTNNPNSSRSHSLIFIKLLKANNDSTTLIIGDFAGVENLFDCDSEKFQEDFFNVKRDDINKDEERVKKINSEIARIKDDQTSTKKREKLEKLRDKLSDIKKEEKFYQTYPIKKYYEEYEKTYDKTNFQETDVIENIDNANCDDKKFKGFNNYPNKYEPYYENESEYIKNYNEVQVIENKINEINAEIVSKNDGIKEKKNEIEKIEKNIIINKEKEKLKKDELQEIESKRAKIEEYKKKNEEKIKIIEDKRINIDEKINSLNGIYKLINQQTKNLPGVSEPDKKIINMLKLFFIGKYIIIPLLVEKLKNELSLLNENNNIIKEQNDFNKNYTNFNDISTFIEEIQKYNYNDMLKYINDLDIIISDKISEITNLPVYDKINKYMTDNSVNDKNFNNLIEVLKQSDINKKKDLKQKIVEKISDKELEQYKNIEITKKYFEEKINNIIHKNDTFITNQEKNMDIYNNILNALLNKYDIKTINNEITNLNNQIITSNNQIQDLNNQITNSNNQIQDLNKNIEIKKVEKNSKENEKKILIDNDIFNKKSIISNINSGTNINELINTLKFDNNSNNLTNKFENIKNDNDKLSDFIQKLKDRYEKENDFNYIIDFKQSSHGSDDYNVNLRRYFEEIFSKKPKKEDIKRDILEIFKKFKENKDDTLGYFTNKKFNQEKFYNQILLLKGIFGLSFPFKDKKLIELFDTKIIYNPENPNDPNNKTMFDIVYEHFQDNCNYINYIKMFIKEFNSIKKDYDVYMEIDYDKNRKNNYGRQVCNVRRNEGVFINDSLSKIRDLINYIIIQKNKNKLNISPPFVDECLNFYCEQGTCFKLKREKIYDEYENNLKNFNKITINENYPFNSVIFNIILEEIREDINKLIISIFCVFNISRRANNPPPVPYIDINLMKFYFFNKNKEFLDELKIFFSYKDNCKNQLCDNLKNNNNDKLSVLCNYNKNKISNILSANIFKSLNSYVDANSINEKNLYNTYKPIIVDFFKFINNFNSASSIGTLEFIDSLSKYNTITNICNYNKLEEKKQKEIDKKYRFKNNEN